MSRFETGKHSNYGKHVPAGGGKGYFFKKNYN
jgi:hypothetical protein